MIQKLPWIGIQDIAIYTLLKLFTPSLSRMLFQNGLLSWIYTISINLVVNFEQFSYQYLLISKCNLKNSINLHNTSSNKQEKFLIYCTLKTCVLHQFFFIYLYISIRWFITYNIKVHFTILSKKFKCLTTRVSIYMHTFRGPNLTNLYEKSTFFFRIKNVLCKREEKDSS